MAFHCQPAIKHSYHIIARSCLTIAPFVLLSVCYIFFQLKLVCLIGSDQDNIFVFQVQSSERSLSSPWSIGCLRLFFAVFWSFQDMLLVCISPAGTLQFEHDSAVFLLLTNVCLVVLVVFVEVSDFYMLWSWIKCLQTVRIFICCDEEMVIDRNCYLNLLSPYNKIPGFAATLYVLIIPIHWGRWTESY
jgi:hypothetical protein